MQLINKYGGATNSPRTTAPSSIVWNNIPLAEILLNPGKGFGFYEDYLNVPLSTTTDKNATVTVVNSSTLVDGGLEGGTLVLTPDTAENDGAQLQYAESFYLDDDSNIAFGARVALLDADQMDVFVGLSITDTSILASAPSDNIGFVVADASANINYIVNKNTAGANVDTGSDAADATYVRLECLITGEDTAKFYVDGVLKATATSGFPNDEVLAPSIAVLTGEAVANTLSVDWSYFYQWYN